MSNQTGKKSEVAVALSYAAGSAPRVTAKGYGEVAEKIIELAQQNDIPFWQDAALAGVLSQVDLGEEIPHQLYRAVAEVIAFAWSLREE